MTCSGVALVATSKSLGAQAHHQVAHGATDDIGLKAGLLEGAHHVERALIHQFGVDAVLAAANFLALAELGLFDLPAAGFCPTTCR